jgi:hypothetical protein
MRKEDLRGRDQAPVRGRRCQRHNARFPERNARCYHLSAIGVLWFPSRFLPRYLIYFSSRFVSETRYQGHARQVASSLDLARYDGIVCVSGDGVLVEVSDDILSNYPLNL